MTSKAKKKAPKKTDAKKTGRPKLATPKTTISFRIPELAEAAFIKLAADETAKSPGREVKVSEVYNQALAEFAKKKGIKVPGWNAAA